MEVVNVNGFQQAYTRIGQGTPLLLIHGYPLDHTIWYDMASFLEDKFELILPDLRGFGLSSVDKDPYTIADLASDMIALLEHLGIEKTYVAGHSMGGYVALAFARKYPQRVLGLGLISTQAPADTPDRKQGRYAAAEEILKSGVQPVAESMSPKLASDQGVQTFVRSLIAAQRAAGLAGALKAMAEREDSTPALSNFQFPVVIVHGETDELIPFERARDVKAVIASAHLTSLPGVGHMPMMEKPEETASALQALT